MMREYYFKIGSILFIREVKNFKDFHEMKYDRLWNCEGFFDCRQILSLFY